MPRDKAAVLVVDDVEDVRVVLSDMLVPYHRVIQAGGAETALAAIDAEHPDVVLLDLDLGQGPEGGFALLARIREQDPTIPVVILSLLQDTDTIVRAMKAGASHYIGKSPRYDQLLETLRLVLDDRSRSLQLEAHREPGDSRILGSSSAMDEVRQRAALAARSDIPVLLLGETGTGKGHVAQWIHNDGRRRGLYKGVNVAAISETFIDSALFGHEKGAFTGADSRRRGLFELAQRGTILLDEIGDLPRSLQIKLLKVAEEGTFARLGAEAELRTDARLMAATHTDLKAMVEAGTFRRDLYHRLKGLVITLPPLRTRKPDIEELARAFEPALLTGRALDTLMEYTWPGNVRELRLTLRRASLLAQAEPVDHSHIEEALRDSNESGERRTADGGVWGAPYDGLVNLPLAEATSSLTDRFRAHYLERLLERCDGNVTAAARASGVARPHLHALLKQYGLGRYKDA